RERLPLWALCREDALRRRDPPGREDLDKGCHFVGCVLSGDPPLEGVVVEAERPGREARAEPSGAGDRRLPERLRDAVCTGTCRAPVLEALAQGCEPGGQRISRRWHARATHGVACAGYCGGPA